MRAVVLSFLLTLAAAASAGAQAAAPAPQDRTAAWREDLDSARLGFLARDRSFSPERRAAFARRMTTLADSVGRLDDDQIIVRLATAVATAGNAHTRLYLLRNRTALRRYPIRVWWFGGELRVVRVQPGYENLLGARVETIAGRPVASLARLVAPLYAGNVSWRRYISTYTLTSPEILHGLRVIDSAGPVAVRVRARDGRTVARVLEPLPLARTNEPTEAWWDLTPLHPGRGGPWLSVLPEDTTCLPLYLRNPLRNYWFERLAGDSVLYVAYNRSQDDSAETTAAFGDRLLAEIARAEPAKLVIDMRFNTGGNLDLAEPLIKRIAALPLAQQRGRLFVITGRATFSAGQYHVALLEQITRALLVGEPLGEGLEYWSEGGNFVLRNSRLTMHFADRFHSYSTREYPERKPYVRDLSLTSLRPDVVVEASFADYLARRDPALDAILRRRSR